MVIVVVTVMVMVVMVLVPFIQDQVKEHQPCNIQPVMTEDSVFSLFKENQVRWWDAIYTLKRN